MKKYSYLLIPIGLVLLMQACTPQPKLQFQASKIELNTPLFTEQWKDGITEIQDGYTIKRSENEYDYRIVSEKMLKKTDLNEVMIKRQKRYDTRHFIKMVSVTACSRGTIRKVSCIRLFFMRMEKRERSENTILKR